MNIHEDHFQNLICPLRGLTQNTRFKSGHSLARPKFNMASSDMS